MSAAPSGAFADTTEPVTGQRYSRILVASEGREIPDAVLDRVRQLLYPEGASVRVLSIARVHGVKFGLPNPGLLPTKAEWDAQREIVRTAIKRLRRRGLDVDGHVVGTRTAYKRICEEAVLQECQAIVMAADTDKSRLVGNLLWEQEPQRVRRHADVPVYLVIDE